MINLPQLPTDNLYKFLTIMGLILVVLPEIVLSPRIEAFEELTYHKLKEIKAEQDEVIFLREDLLKASKNQITISSDSVEQKMRRARLKSDLSNVDLEHIKKIKEDINMLSDTMTFAFWGGFIIFTFGYFLWWIRVQRPQDKMLQKGLKDSK